MATIKEERKERRKKRKMRDIIEKVVACIEGDQEDKEYIGRVSYHVNAALNVTEWGKDIDVIFPAYMATMLWNFSKTEVLLNVLMPGEQNKKIIQQILDIIKLCKNLSIKPSDVKDDEIKDWMFYPRWAHFLENTGRFGLRRAFNIFGEDRLETPNTQKVKTRQELYDSVVTEKRFLKYKETETSESFLDHLYDNVFHIRGEIYTDNSYIIEKADKKHKLVEDFVIDCYEVENILDVIEDYGLDELSNSIIIYINKSDGEGGYLRRK